MIQYINLLTIDGKSLIFRDYGNPEVDRDLLDGFLNEFSGFMKEKYKEILNLPLLKQYGSEIISTATEDFKYFYTIIDEIIIVVCADLDDDNTLIKSKITTIRARFIEKYGKILEDGSWVGNRTIFAEFKKELDNAFLGPIKVGVIGSGGVGKTDLLRLICGKDIDLKYIQTINVDIVPFNSEELDVTRSIVLWDFAGQSNFRSLWKNLLDSTDIALLLTDSTFENINASKEIIHDILDKSHKDILVIGLANYQDMPNRLTPEFCEKLFSNKGRTIKFHGIVAHNPLYREKILAILKDAIIKISNGEEEIKCEHCGNAFTRKLNQTEMEVKDIFYCPKCKFPLHYIYNGYCSQYRSSNPLMKPGAINKKDNIPNKRFMKQWIDYFGVILKKKDQIYSNIELEYLEVQNKLDSIAKSFFSGVIDEKIIEIYSLYVEKCNYPRDFEEKLQIPKCYFLEKGDITYIIIGVLLDSTYKKIASFIENLDFNNINIGNLDKVVKVRIRDFMETYIEGIENYLKSGDPRFEEELFKSSRIAKFTHRISSNWKLKLERGKLERKELRKLQKQRMKDLLQCPLCGAPDKCIKKIEDKSKIVYYFSMGIPIYAKKHICKLCGYEF